MAIAAVGLVLTVVFAEPSKGTAPTSDPVIERVHRAVEASHQKFDRIDSDKGRAGIQRCMDTAPINKLTMLIAWMGDRNKVAYFDILSAATLDSRNVVKYCAIGACSDVSPFALKAYLSTTQAAESIEPILAWKRFLGELIVRVQQA